MYIYLFFFFAIFLQAEKWLIEQAQKEGWAKADKLQSRPMSQGLVGVLQSRAGATMVEVSNQSFRFF